jgi:hypothetical protein
VSGLCGRNPGGGGGVGLGNSGGIRANSLLARSCIVGLGGGAGNLGHSRTASGARGPNGNGGGGLGRTPSTATSARTASIEVRMTLTHATPTAILAQTSVARAAVSMRATTTLRAA